MYNELKDINPSPTMGYVYILYNPESELVKIGRTKKPKNRFSVLSNQNGTTFKYYITEQIYIENILEKVMHIRFHKNRVKGEWFSNLQFEDAVKELKIICNSEDFNRRNIKRG